MSYSAVMRNNYPPSQKRLPNASSFQFMEDTRFDAMPQRTVERTSGNSTKLINCGCCPYGYHIDLDFINYCEQLAANAQPPSSEQRQRRDKRRQRKSMEVMLGFGEQLALQQRQLERQEEISKLFPIVPEVSALTPDQASGDLRLSHFISGQTHEFDDHVFREGPPVSERRSTFNIQQIKQNYDARCRAASVPTCESEEKSAFVDDILYDVCSDFERTLERTKKKHHDYPSKSYKIPLRRLINSRSCGRRRTL